jgi:DNA replication protein DnaC
MKMNNNSTLERMKELKLLGMLLCFSTSLKTGEHEHITADELLAILIEAEYDYRRTKRIKAAFDRAHFRYQANIEDISFSKIRNLDKNTFVRLADCSFIKKKEGVIVTGSTGVGKSYLVSALGHQACIMGYKVLYYNLGKLFALLRMSKADNSYLKVLARIAKADVLILDDFGLQAFDSTNCLTLLEIIEDRHGKSSTIIASQVPINKWHELLGEQTLADAILDRIIHTSTKIELKGDSMRKPQPQK